MNFGCLVLIIVALFSGGWFAWDWYSQRPHRERVVAEKASFMKEFNPQLKSLHDKLQAELDSCEANLKNLKGLARSFNQPNAKAAVEGKIRVFEGKAESLRGQLNRIEEEAEKGVALRTFNQIDGGGMVDQDMSELLKDSQSVLSDAVNSRKQMATEFGQPSMDDIDETRVTSKSSSSTGNRVAVVERVSVEITTYRVVRTSDGYLNMRTGPGLGYPSRGRILGTARGLIQIGELVYDQKDDIQWMPVRIGGVEGFVSSNFLQRE
jgi:hypothetical protein